MKFVDLKCPNCGGRLIKNDDSLKCESCEAVFAIDYDESDVEYEKIKLQKMQIDREEKTVNEKQSDTKFSLIIFVFLFVLIAGPVTFLIFQRVAINTINNEINSNENEDWDEELIIDYNVSGADVKKMLDEFIKSGRIVEMNIDECAYWDKIGAARYYDKTDAVFDSAYLIKDIPNTKPFQSNRLVIIYKVTWNNDNYGEQICYDAVYFEGLSVNPNGGIISDFDGMTISRSDAAWGWSMAYSFEEWDQCYRENVTALGGNVEKIE